MCRTTRQALVGNGLALQNLGSVTEQSIAGAISTGTHGSGLSKGSLSTAVTALQLVLANGTVIRCSQDLNADLFGAARVGLVSPVVADFFCLGCARSFLHVLSITSLCLSLGCRAVSVS